MAYYFVSDVHAGLQLDGIPTGSGEALERWLDQVAPDADAVFLLGDIFDFWFEYKKHIPQGYDSLLLKLKELTGKGIEIHFFQGNHDMWTLDYLSRECGLIVHTKGGCMELYGRKVFMDHGDVQSVSGVLERLMQRIFRSKVAQAIGRTLVPYRCIMNFGNNWSRSSRSKHECSPHIFRKEQEGTVRFARKYLKTNDVDLFVFGHLHAPAEYEISEKTTLYVLGGWVLEQEAVYGRMDASGFSLEKFRK